MEISSMHFVRNAKKNLKNSTLQQSMQRAQGKFVNGRADAMAALGNFEALREAAKQIRDKVLNQLDAYLEIFERHAQEKGAIVHWAKNSADVAAILLEIVEKHQVKKVVKSKSMVSEECEVNLTLESAGVEVVETDLGEYIIQLAKEPPSHIVAPALHKSKEEVSTLFAEHHHTEAKTEIQALCSEAREVLRQHFVTADMGISGANFAIAETGSVLLVTNEGNGRLVTTLPKVHVAITGIEKVIPTFEDAATLLRLLPRSATGQSISNYVSILTGTKQPQDQDGPEAFHIILVDNGRSQLLGGEIQPMLRCIRCGACMNHCPVYQNIGGHSYGWVYPGPMGSILTPSYVGIENALDLPHASTLCGACQAVCPVGIPLTELLRALRNKQFDRNLRPSSETIGLKTWGWLAKNPTLYRLAAHGAVKAMPYWRFYGGWTVNRELPQSQGQTFHSLYKNRKKIQKQNET